MADLMKVLERQAAWQRARARLTWTEKLRMAAKLRDVAVNMRPPAHRRRDAAAVAESSADHDNAQAVARPGV